MVRDKDSYTTNIKKTSYEVRKYRLSHMASAIMTDAHGMACAENITKQTAEEPLRARRT